MDRHFQIRARWPERPEAEQRDIAELSLWVDDAALTRLADIETGENRAYFRASAVSLALWLTDNWWRLRYEPLHDARLPAPDWRLRHELSSISGGSLWPPLMVYGTGERVVVAPAFGASLAVGPVRYLGVDGVYSLAGPAYEAGVDQFLESVVSVCARARDGATLAALVRQLGEERKDEEVAAWRRLEARLGYDPDAAPQSLMDHLTALEDDVGEQAVEEAAVAAPGAAAGTTLEAVIGATQASKLAVDLSISDIVDPKVLQISPTPWRVGEEVARMVRKAVDVSYGPLDEAALSRLAGRKWRDVAGAAATARQLPYAARLTEHGQDAKLALQTRFPVDRRFEFARIVGDALWARRDALGIISRAKTERQKFQRAFAHSLLLPFNELNEFIDFDDPTDRQINGAARRYAVRPSVVETALVVKGVLPRETLTERLEAA